MLGCFAIGLGLVKDLCRCCYFFDGSFRIYLVLVRVSFKCYLGFVHGGFRGGVVCLGVV